MKDKLQLAHLARGGAMACVGLVPGTRLHKSAEPSTHLWIVACGRPAAGLGAGQACGSASPTPLLDGATCHRGTRLPSCEMLVGDEELFRDVAWWHRSLAGLPRPSLAAEMPGGSCGQNIPG